MATINGTKLSDFLMGAADADSISGLDGSDTLFGLDGNDTLNGGKGADLMDGGDGGDTYIVDHIGDIVRDFGASGLDEVVTSMSYSLATLPSIENLTLSGNAAISGSGNALPNLITGNNGANSLFGAAGADVLEGGAGNDTLDGGAGEDSMRGGDGNDTYIVDTAFDSTFEGAGAKGGIDTVISSTNAILYPFIENMVLVGKGAFLGQGNDLNNRITGSGGDNQLNGGLGNDTLDGGDSNDDLFGGKGADLMIGGAGNDRYFVDDKGDRIQESIAGIAGGIDTLQCDISGTFVLSANLENLQLNQSAVGIGNALDNSIMSAAVGATLVGLAGNDTLTGSGAGGNTLDGGAGADAMSGGTGNDLFVVDNGADFVEGGAGIDEIRTNLSLFQEVADVENYTFTGAAVSFSTDSSLANNKLTGTKFGDFLSSNVGSDTLVGGAGNDTLFGGVGTDLLDGGAGADSMTGGSDSDEYIVDNAKDIVDESSSGTDSIDTVRSSMSFSLGAPTVAGNVEFLVLTGKGAINGTGNGLDNNIAGNVAANKLDGGVGADTLNGDAGNDTLTVDAFDVVIGGTGIDTVIATASVNLSATLDVENYILGKGAGAISITTGDGGEKITGNESANTISAGGANDTIDGGGGNDFIIGGAGSNKISVVLGNDTVQSGLVGLAAHDLIGGFDGNAAGGQDFVSLTTLFDNLGIGAGDRINHVDIVDKGSIVEIRVDTSTTLGGDGVFDLLVATLQTNDHILKGEDVLL